jgi:ribosome-binding protein aMBF1 (putative translation factor)
MMNFSQRLKIAIEESGLKQKDIANKVAISKQCIEDENGKRIQESYNNINNSNNSGIIGNNNKVNIKKK